MKIRLKLMGNLRAKLADGNTLDVPDGTTIDGVLKKLDIPSNHVHLVMVNDRHELDRTYALTLDDELMVMPPVGGG